MTSGSLDPGDGTVSPSKRQGEQSDSLDSHGVAARLNLMQLSPGEVLLEVMRVARVDEIVLVARDNGNLWDRLIDLLELAR